MFGIKVEAELAGDMLYIVNEDAPGFIGRLGTTLGEAGVNIGTFHLGRRERRRRSGAAAVGRRAGRAGLVGKLEGCPASARCGR
jgi:D-3-phosphoglycerate dehydrogenase